MCCLFVLACPHTENFPRIANCFQPASLAWLNGRLYNEKIDRSPELPLCTRRICNHRFVINAGRQIDNLHSTAAGFNCVCACQPARPGRLASPGDKVMCSVHDTTNTHEQTLQGVVVQSDRQTFIVHEHNSVSQIILSQCRRRRRRQMVGRYDRAQTHTFNTYPDILMHSLERRAANDMRPLNTHLIKYRHRGHNPPVSVLRLR